MTARQKRPRLTKFRCAICNARLRECEYVFSRWTRQRYCLDLDKHFTIARRRNR